MSLRSQREHPGESTGPFFAVPPPPLVLIRLLSSLFLQPSDLRCGVNFFSIRRLYPLSC